MKKILKTKRLCIVFILIILLTVLTIGIYYFNLYTTGDEKLLDIYLNGDEIISLEYGSTYNELGATATYDKKDTALEITGQVDNEKIGTYEITYIAKYKKAKKHVTRTIKIEDTVSPTITLNGEKQVNLYVGSTYNDPGIKAIDNYDKDITDKVTITNNIDINTPGTYEIIYTSTDTSGNTTQEKRTIIYQNKIENQKVAVLNYHFFYDSSIGEVCNESICEDVKDFKEQLNYLRDNGFTTLTIEQFKSWMYNESPIPEKSVLITIDDGAMGTGLHNGNKLIPILEEYKMHATLFLITGWWDINNYKSDYLDIESHTNDMHTGNLCQNQTRGAQLLCSSNDDVMNDLKKSIEITSSNTAFCFPFYAYNETAIKQVQESGFKLAFIGGSYKATQNTNKYKIPRYPIQKTDSITKFANIVN